MPTVSFLRDDNSPGMDATLTVRENEHFKVMVGRPRTMPHDILAAYFDFLKGPCDGMRPYFAYRYFPESNKMIFFNQVVALLIEKRGLKGRGAVLIRLYGDAEEGEPVSVYYDAVCTKPGKGYGRILMHELSKVLPERENIRRSGANTIDLESTNEAEGFYRHLGFDGESTMLRMPLGQIIPLKNVRRSGRIASRAIAAKDHRKS